MSAKHTPGPWRVDPNYNRDVQDANGCEVGAALCVTDIGEKWTISGRITASREEGAANARLIASAPELLAALREMVADVDGGGSVSPYSVDAARAAIAKAEGRDA